MKRVVYDRRYMVKHFLCELETGDGRRFRVYESGDPKWVIFKPIRNGCESTLDIPVKRSNLKVRIPRP